MPDIVSQGGDREPSRRTRWAAVAAAVALVAALIGWHLAGPGPARSPAAPATSAPAAGRTGPADVVVREPDGITGTAWPASVRLPSAGARPTWFWPASGRRTAIGGLPALRAGYQFIRVAGGWAVQASPAVQAGCGGCAGLPRPVWFLGDQARSVRQVGLAAAVAPGAAAGTLWLTSYPATGSRDPGSVSGTAQEVSTAGAAIGPRLRLPAGYEVAQGTVRGLLLALVTPQPGVPAGQLWPPSGAVTQTFAGVIAASATEIAWAEPCQALCQVQMLNLVTGRRSAAALPPGSSAVNAAFSPDGRYLAVQVSSSSDGALAMQLEVMPVATGRLTAVPHTFVSSDALVSFGWPGGTDRLVTELSFTSKLQLAAWRPGADRVAVAVVKPQPHPPALAIAPGPP